MSQNTRRILLGFIVGSLVLVTIIVTIAIFVEDGEAPSEEAVTNTDQVITEARERSAVRTPASITSPTNRRYLAEARQLWNELQEMKNDPEFLLCGYGEGCGPGAAWARRVNLLSDKVDASFSLSFGFYPSDLWSLGTDYMSGNLGDPRIEQRVKEGLRK